MDILSEKKLLIDGFLKKLLSTFGNNKTITCPKCLNDLIMKYVDNIWNMHFDSYPSKFNHHIQENGKLIVKPQPHHLHKITRYIICASQSISNRINEFRIQCVQPKSDCIGIISNTETSKNDNMFWSMSKGNLYYYWGGGGILYGLSTENRPKETSLNYPDHAEWNQGDIITVRVDCNKWIVTFFKNDTQIGDNVNIIPNMSYYPMMGLQSNDVKYRVI
eukprot:303219_1